MWFVYCIGQYIVAVFACSGTGLIRVAIVKTDFEPTASCRQVCNNARHWMVIISVIGMQHPFSSGGANDCKIDVTVDYAGIQHFFCEMSALGALR